MSNGELAKTVDALLRLGAFKAPREVMLSEDLTDPEWAERTCARITEDGISIAYQHQKPPGESWQTWQDMGATLSWAEFLELVNVIEKESDSVDPSS